MQQQLLSSLCERYQSRPVLVIGGGASALKDLERIPRDYPACVISANQHGFMQDRFLVDFVVSVDYTFASSRTPMQEYLAQFCAVNINRWSWADYRIPEWSYGGDSGLTAIMVAALIGGHPVIPVGMDRYTGDRRYFWEATLDPKWAARRQGMNVNARANNDRCITFCEPTCVRVFSGPLREYWPHPTFNAATLPPFVPHPAPQRTLTGKLYNVHEPIFLHPTDRVTEGPILLTDQEAKGFLRFSKISRIQEESLGIV